MARLTDRVGGVALAVAIACAAGPALAQGAAPDPDAATGADAQALHEYNLFAAQQAAHTGAAMFKSGYTQYSINYLEKAVRLAPNNGTYRKALAEARARLAEEQKAAQRPTQRLATGEDEDSGIHVPGFVPPATVAGAQPNGPASAIDQATAAANCLGDDAAGTSEAGRDARKTASRAGRTATKSGPFASGSGRSTDGAVSNRASCADSSGGTRPGAADRTSRDAAQRGSAGGPDRDKAAARGIDEPQTLTGAAHYNLPFGTVPGGPATSRPGNDLAIQPVESSPLDLPATANTSARPSRR